MHTFKKEYLLQKLYTLNEYYSKLNVMLLNTEMHVFLQLDENIFSLNVYSIILVEIKGAFLTHLSRI